MTSFRGTLPTVASIVVALVAGCSKGDGDPGSSKAATQKQIVKQYAAEGYAQWSRRHPTQRCPSSLMDIATEIGRTDTLDVWGRELMWFCGDSVPPAASQDGFAVASAGPDGKPQTADDVASWD